MNGIEYIMYRHYKNSGFSSVISFGEGMSARRIVQYVDCALANGKVTAVIDGTYSVVRDAGRMIVADIVGNEVSIMLLVNK